MRTLYFDLDGTIFDVSERSYRVYQIILKKHKKRFLLKGRYIKMKREKTPIEDILKETKAENIISDYKREWLRNIEREKYLNFDKLPQKRKKVLSALKRKYNLVLITLRKKRKSLYNELHEKGIYSIFSKILIAGEGWEEKTKVIKKEGSYKNTLLVGDTETDILVAKKLNIRSIAVFSGMRSKTFLEKFSPDFIIKDIAFIEKTLLKK